MTATPNPIRILHLDDDPLDAELLTLTLESAKGRLPFSVTYVATREQFLEQLSCTTFDVILSDYRMPGFDGDEALRLARELCPETPFIMVTGELGEERAIETLKRGASDYVLKDRMFRLVPAIERALAEAANERKRREAEEDANRAHQAINEVLESVQDPFYAVDGAWRFTYVNSKAEPVLGKRRDELLGRILWETFPQALGTESERQLRRVMEERVAVHYETRSAVSNAWIDVRVSPKADGGISVLYRDISERKSREQALRSSEERFAAAFQSSTYPLAISRVQDGVFVDVNGAFLAFYGMAKEEIIGRSSLDIGILADPRERTQLVELLRRDGAVRDFEMHVKTRTQGERVVLLSVSLLRESTGQTMLTVIHDVTAVREAQKELQRSHQRLSEILESIQDAFYAIDREFRITYVNRRAEEAFRRQREELVGKLLLEAFPEAAGGSSIAAIERAMRERVTVTYETVSLGLHSWIEVHVYPAADGGLSIYFRDITDRKHAEEALYKAEERLRLALEAADLGTFDLDLTTNVAVHSPRHDQMFGYREPVPAWTFEIATQHVLAEDLPIVLAAHARAEKTGVLDFEARVVWPDGTIHWIAPRGIVHYDDEGRPVRIVGVVAEITERKRAEESLRESELRYRTLFNAIDEGFCIIEVIFDEGGKPVDYRFLETNPSFEKQTGLVNAQGKRIRALVPEHEEHWFEIYGQVALTGTPARFERPAEQLRRYYDVYAFRFGRPENRQVAVLFDDITERHRSAETLQEIALFPEQNPSPVLRIDSEGKLLYANPASAELLSRHGSAVGKSAPAPLVNAVRGIIREGGTDRCDIPLGDSVYSFQVVPLQKRGYANLYGRDVTRERNAEAALRKLSEELEMRIQERTRQLEAANRELEAFSYSVSHDLKAPLRIIDGFARLLTDRGHEASPEKKQEYVASIRSGAEQMATLIDSLLSFARVTGYVPHMVRVDLRSLAEQAVREQQRVDGGTRVNVLIGDLPAAATGDPLLLKQVFANLLSNAFKFTRNAAAPTVEIGGYRNGGELVYFVRDNGVGFPAAARERLFQVFQRLHGHQEFEGSGVGLANVRKIVERHGGSVWAVGEEGKGATFYFTLPEAQ